MLLCLPKNSSNANPAESESTADMLEKLSEFLKNPQRHGTKRLHFASLILLDAYPSTHPTGQIANLSASLWSDVLNTHILYPISLAHAFLPLVISESKSSIPSRTFLVDSNPNQPPTTLLVVTPTNIPSLYPPLHAPESLTTAALTSYVATLRSELPTSLSLTHIRLSSFSPLAKPFNRLNTALARLHRMRSGSESSSDKSSSSPPRSAAPHLRAENLHAGSFSGLRELHNGVFDAIVGRRAGTVFLGRGARTYSYVGHWMPAGLMARMLGYNSQMDDGRRLGVEKNSSEDLGIGGLEWERVDDA